MDDLGKLVISILLILVVDMIIALPVMWLWNAIIPNLCGFKYITYTQSFGLTLLVSLLTYKI